MISTRSKVFTGTTSGSILSKFEACTFKIQNDDEFYLFKTKIVKIY